MFRAFCFFYLGIFTCFPDWADLVRIKKLEVKYSTEALRVECTVSSPDPDRDRSIPVRLYFDGEPLAVRKWTNIYSSSLANWKHRLDAPIRCEAKRGFWTSNQTIKLTKYAPREEDIGFENPQPLVAGDTLVCAAHTEWPANVTIKEGKEGKTGPGWATFTVSKSQGRATFECDVENAIGRKKKMRNVEIVRPSIKVALHGPPFFYLGLSKDIDCGHLGSSSDSHPLASSSAPPLASILLEIFSPDSSQLVRVLWRPGNTTISQFPRSKSGVVEVRSTKFGEQGSYLKVHLKYLKQFTSRVRCRVQLKNGSVGIDRRTFSVRIPPKVLNISLRNEWGKLKTKFRANQTIFVTCNVQFNTKSLEEKPTLQMTIGKKTKGHSASANSSEFSCPGRLLSPGICRAFKWVLRATPLLSSVACEIAGLRRERTLSVQYLSKPWFNFSSPHNIFPGQGLLCSAQGYTNPRFSFEPPWPFKELHAGVALVTIPKNTRSANYTLMCYVSNSGGFHQFHQISLCVQKRRLVSAAGSIWRSHQWLWVVAVVISLAFLGFAVTYWWRSQQALEKERRAHRRGNSSCQLLEVTPSPCRTPDSGLGTPEMCRRRPPATDADGVVYAQLDFDERAAASKRPWRPSLWKKSKPKRSDSAGSIVYDEIVGEVVRQA